jgi:hypothetical protein
MKTNGEVSTGMIIGTVAVVIGVLVALAIALPLYNVWSSEQAGKARLAEAQSSRMIAVTEANAKNESATYLAQAEITRARGVAQSNQIIGDSLKNNSVYLDYLWITEKIGTDADKEIVYVPTEAQLPILEAGRGLSTSRRAQA